MQTAHSVKIIFAFTTSGGDRVKPRNELRVSVKFLGPVSDSIVKICLSSVGAQILLPSRVGCVGCAVAGVVGTVAAFQQNAHRSTPATPRNSVELEVFLQSVNIYNILLTPIQFMEPNNMMSHFQSSSFVDMTHKLGDKCCLPPDCLDIHENFQASKWKFHRILGVDDQVQEVDARTTTACRLERLRVEVAAAYIR
jgi:hypothetical protein